MHVVYARAQQIFANGSRVGNVFELLVDSEADLNCLSLNVKLKAALTIFFIFIQSLISYVLVTNTQGMIFLLFILAFQYIWCVCFLSATLFSAVMSHTFTKKPLKFQICFPHHFFQTTTALKAINVRFLASNAAPNESECCSASAKSNFKKGSFNSFGIYVYFLSCQELDETIDITNITLVCLLNRKLQLAVDQLSINNGVGEASLALNED